ncbi:hypothetical protein [Mycobacterium tuberculosis]|uniref:hypothetical protein n=1 Tax=Mycobacterium tuberculosis TaxID=1773 RepID=UPI000C9AE37C|nr:hypothetical protein [Mycobacterium tuberculosis]AUP95630.1 hypothetical protein C0096_08635 [Mycobacterium tuberculosis]
MTTTPARFNHLVTVTDLETGDRVDWDRDQVAETIRAWFPDAPLEVREALVRLQAALNRHEHTGELEAFLRISVEHADAAGGDECGPAILAGRSGPEQAAINRQLGLAGDDEPDGDDTPPWSRMIGLGGGSPAEDER